MVPTVLATSIALLILLANRVIKLAPIMVQSGKVAGELMALIVYMIPPYLVTATPIAFYINNPTYPNGRSDYGEIGCGGVAQAALTET